MMHPCKRNCLVALHELLAVLLLVPVAAFAAHAQQSTGVPSSSAGDKPPYNIVFLIVDQRTYRLLAGSDYSLPALDSIARHGVTFQNHYISSAMCSPSRASFLTGQPPQVNGVIDQMEYAFQQSLSPNLTAPGMPDALLEYQKGWDAWSGVIPTDRKDMWSIFYNYYLNTIQDNDRSLQEIVDTLNDMDFWRDTVVIFTADHGEMGGTHGGLKGKGPFPYEENAHVPLIIAHPAGKAGATSSAITSHLDLLPTFVGLTGLPDAKRPQAVKALPGRDFSALLADPEKASITAVRPAVLFNYVGPATVDGDYLGTIMSNLFLRKPSPPLSQANLKKRGFLSFVFDGRYKFARYYAPTAFNTPRTLDEIFKNNDVQLFDLQNDPEEMHNLALEPDKNRATILRMNVLLNDLIAKEVGVNDGRFLAKVIGRK